MSKDPGIAVDFSWELSMTFGRGLWLLHPGIARVGGAGPPLPGQRKRSGMLRMRAVYTERLGSV